MVLVSHRQSTMGIADRVYSVENGRMRLNPERKAALWREGAALLGGHTKLALLTRKRGAYGSGNKTAEGAAGGRADDPLVLPKEAWGTNEGALSGLCSAGVLCTAPTEKCPFMESKTFCSNCRVHCYCPDMRAKIRMVMRFSGPRMLFYHPVLAIRHLVESTKGKRRWIGYEDQKLVYLLLGCLGLGLGAVGAVLPMLPAFPFDAGGLLLCKSSLPGWTGGSGDKKLYKDNLESYVQGRGMTWQAKRRIMLLVTALMSVGFVIMAAQSVWGGLCCAGWRMGFHIVYFIWGSRP